ncbi:MAG TPA: TetR/AcrR family transcriptional regulator C-terminal domain-containing protein [Polyangiaceae bacterium]|nr:TetR/AcrR family transcriptional regulator C-terminal domain-containing protein [Polyangiaceae bacterium]
MYRDSGRASWQAECSALCHHIRQALLQHPRWIALMTRLARPPEIPLRERLITLMTSDGVALEDALIAIWNLIMLTIGFVGTELSFRDTQGGSIIAQQFELLREVAGQPSFAQRERLTHLALQNARPFDMNAHFSAAVATFIDGIAAQRLPPVLSSAG